jgi:hypothetical protein
MQNKYVSQLGEIVNSAQDMGGVITTIFPSYYTIIFLISNEVKLLGNIYYPGWLHATVSIADTCKVQALLPDMNKHHFRIFHHSK